MARNSSCSSVEVDCDTVEGCLFLKWTAAKMELGDGTYNKVAYGKVDLQKLLGIVGGAKYNIPKK